MFLLLAVFIASIRAQYVPRELTSITRRTNTYGDYGVETQADTTYNYTPLSRFQYASNSVPYAEGYKYVWDTIERRWRLAADWRCDGEMVDYVWGQPRFLCNCRSFGGITYQIGTCNPVVPDIRQGK